MKVRVVFRDKTQYQYLECLSFILRGRNVIVSHKYLHNASQQSARLFICQIC